MLHYNENKVLEKSASLMLAIGFATDVIGMSLTQKLQRFEHLTMLNGKVKTNAVHISLNFDNEDKLNDDQLQRITIAYMDKIGFGDQPYLVYKHNDAAHPHIHIATTNMKADGKRIDLHGIGRTLSETARKDIEKEFNLIKAEGRQLSNTLGIKAADIEKASYGKIPTKRAINNIVNAVVSTYKFTSLAEFNSILLQFNVIADRGKENSLMFQKNGLMYSLINEKGEQVGVPIKASALYNQPTLKNLEIKFGQNLEKRKAYRENLKEAIESIFSKYANITKATFITEMAKQNINIAFRQNESGFIYGVTFIDNKNKTVFNGSDLGKTYSVKALTTRFENSDKLVKPELKTYLKPVQQTDYLKKDQSVKTYLKPLEPTNYLKGLLSKTTTDFASGMPFKKKKKKKGQVQEHSQSL